MRRVVLLPLLLLCWLSPPALAARIDAVYDLLGLPQIIAIMREEGIAYGTDMEADLFPGRGGARWAAMVERIYDIGAMEQSVRQGLDAALAGTDLAPLEAFLGSERGRRIIRLEISARRALLDESVDRASRERLDEMILSEAPRLDAIRDFAEVNDLVESNVTGAMNANYAFYRALADGGAFPEEVSDEDMLADVWSQEAEIRDETEQWLFAYLAMAYQPISDEDLAAYIDFSRSAEGQAMNRALFVAFDAMFVDISRALGLAASRFIAGEEL